MLKIKAPIETRCTRNVSSLGEAFGQRILGNYLLTSANIEREDLLHVVMAPPEVYIGGGDSTSILQNTRIQNNRETKLEVINNLLNRISVTEEVKLTYQDRVYITDVLHRLGITNVSQFMKELSSLKQETRNVNELTDLYWNHMEELNRTVEELKNRSGDLRNVEQISNSQTRLHLHEDIMNRLQTGAVYQILNNFYSEPAKNSDWIGGQELTFSEQQRVVSGVLLNRLQTQTAGKPVPFVYRHENYFEENRLEETRMTEETVNSRITSAILLNLADNLYQNLSERSIRSSSAWLHVENALYQSAENTLNRLSYALAEQRDIRTRVSREHRTDNVRVQEREIETLREILSLHGQHGTARQEGEKLSYETTQTQPGQPPEAEIIFPFDASADEQQEPAVQQLLSEKETEQITDRLLEKSLERITEDRILSQASTKTQEEPAKSTTRFFGENEPEPPASLKKAAPSYEEEKEERLPSLDTARDQTIGTAFERAEKSEAPAEKQEGGVGQTENVFTRILNQYLSIIYRPGESGVGEIPPMDLTLPGTEEDVDEEARPLISEAVAERMVENNRTDRAATFAGELKKTEREAGSAELLLRTEFSPARQEFTEAANEIPSRQDEETVRERDSSTLVSQQDLYQIYRNVNEAELHYTEQSPAADQEPLAKTDEKELIEQLQEINRRNIENYQRYQQLVPPARQEFTEAANEIPSRQDDETVRERESSTLVSQQDLYQNYRNVNEAELHYTGQSPAADQEPLTEPDEKELMEQLQEINRRNIENYQRYQQLVQVRREEEREQRQKEKPAALKMREESLKALENPQSVIEEHFRKETREEERLNAAGRAMEELIPEETRAIYEQVFNMQQARARSADLGAAEQNSSFQELIYDIQKTEQENEIHTRELSREERELKNTTDRVIELRKEYETVPLKAAGREWTERQNLSLVHRSLESRLDEEELNELLEQNRFLQRDTHVTNRVEENRREENITVRQQTTSTQYEEKEDIEKLIQRGVQSQMGVLSDQIYARLERRLENEKKRRGY